jgi:hypothetical protein
MSDKPEEKPVARAKPPAPAKPPEEKEKVVPPPKSAKIVEETGCFICKHAITFTNDKGERAHAKAGDVVGVSAEDAKHLKRTGAIVPETTEE